MKTLAYIVALVGLIALLGGVYEDFIHKGHHQTLGLVALIAGIVLLIVGLIGAFAIKPKAA
jgi:multisubunit Na+/H+ antiporter MnhG subunit